MVMTNPNTHLYKIFWENIRPYSFYSNIYRENRLKREQKKKKQLFKQKYNTFINRMDIEKINNNQTEAENENKDRER